MVMIFLFGSKQNLFQKRYKVRAIFGNVSGLRVGAPVFVAGVNVGSVDRLRFVSAAEVSVEPTPVPGEEAENHRPMQFGKVEISLDIEDRFKDQIRSDSVATIGSVGLLGDKSVDISVGSAGEAVVAPDDVLHSVDPLTLSDVIDRIAPIRDKLDKILGDLSEVTGNLTGEDTPIARSLRNVSSILDKIDSGEGTLGQLINSPTIGNRLDEVLQQVDSLAASVRTAAEQIQRATVDLPETMASARKVADEVATLSVKLRQTADEFPAIVKDLRVVTENLKIASQSFPSLAVETEAGVGKATQVFDAAGKTIFLRGYIDNSVQQLPTALERGAPAARPAAPAAAPSHAR
jgi:phospholipid/cholesterol/gamma-HCH transport system substrate-binding protein